MSDQVLLAGSYRPPELVNPVNSNPPHTIIRVPVHTAMCVMRAVGALVVAVAFHVLFDGLYRPPVFSGFKPVVPPDPPQTIISVPVHTAVWPDRSLGALVVVIGVHVSVAGSYRPPVLVRALEPFVPPQTIISVPVQTAV